VIKNLWDQKPLGSKNLWDQKHLGSILGERKLNRPIENKVVYSFERPKMLFKIETIIERLNCISISFQYKNNWDFPF
jgi:hypothetical protein